MTSFIESLVRKNSTAKIIWSCIKWPLVCHNWYLAIPACLNLWKHKFVIYKFRDGTRAKAELNPTDFQILREAYIHDTYGLSNVDFKKVKYIVDGGAHIGFPAINIALRNPRTTIFCIEPFQQTENILKENIALNNVKNIRTLDFAISGRDEIRKFYVTKYSSLHSLTKEKIKPWLKNIQEVQCYSLQTILKLEKIPRIDLLKLDVEGEEYDILYSLHNKLLSKIRYLLVEAHPVGGESIDKLEIFLKKKGFVIHRPYVFENVIFAERKEE